MPSPYPFQATALTWSGPGVSCTTRRVRIRRASDAADCLEALVAGLPLPRRLGEVGVRRDELGPIAAATMSDYMMANSPVPMTVDDVRGLLDEAFE